MTAILIMMSLSRSTAFASRSLSLQFLLFITIISIMAGLQIHRVSAHPHFLHFRKDGGSVTIGEEESSNQLDISTVTEFPGAAQPAKHLRQRPEEVRIRKELTSYNRRSRKERRLLSTNDGQDLELKALISFKTTVTSDPLGDLNDWHENDSMACNWTGVVCSADHHVIDLDLHGSQLVGPIGSGLLALSGLPRLQNLDLSNNFFSGSISGTALGNFSSLVDLNLAYNELSGSIPSQIGDLANLQTLNLERNQLSRQLPVSLANCSSLRVLNLGTNLLEGSIPPAFGRLSSLEFLNLGSLHSVTVGTLGELYTNKTFPWLGNKIDGSIPSSLGNCSSLTHLDLGFNKNLGGALPPHFGQLQKLQNLQLLFCSFNDFIPTWLGNLTSLGNVSFANNSLHGQIPDAIGRLSQLRTLSLGQNSLTGVIPVSIANCSLLSSLEMGQNSFSGVIPAALANCSLLETLILGNNPWMDPELMPSWITSLTSLTYVDLQSMRLHGQIPEDLGTLAGLRYLYLQENNLTGGIPQSISNCTMNQLMMQYNKLTGRIPPEVGLLTDLTSLTLYNNSLRGHLPPFSNLTRLDTLDLSNNFLSGNIGDDWGNFPQLTAFYVGTNRLSGLVPTTVSNCSKLLFVDFSFNHLTGEIPHSYGNMTKLQMLLLGGNHLRGVFPEALTKCSSLGVLCLRMSNLTGDIPSNIGDMGSLWKLYLDNNQFTGYVPDSLGNCSRITVLDLSHNLLTGSLPGESISNIVPLLSFNLSHNRFSGEWSAQLNSLGAIQEIDISSNNVSGGIRGLGSSAGKLQALTRLDISGNRFSGIIPQSVANLPDLKSFNASFNNFEGKIPHFNFSITELSFMGNPNLCGSLLGPGRGCPPSSGNDKSCKAFRCKGVWIPTISALAGTIVVLALAIGVLMFFKKPQARGIMDACTFESKFCENFSTSDMLRIIHGGGADTIGAGARSVVYKGSLPRDSNKVIAVKVLSAPSADLSTSTSAHGANDSCDKNNKQLVREAQMLSKLRHRNIVRVVGYCFAPDITAIILEYMSQGSLHRHLYPSEGSSAGGTCKLPWQVRLEIAIGVGEGMKYLHHEFPVPTIHGDLKPSNILLDDNLVPKVADFGLSKFTSPDPCRAGEASASQSTICGTIGYMPPEYASGTTVSTKGDVFSYGITVLELLTGKSPNKMTANDISPDSTYRGWAMECFQKAPLSLLDTTLRNEGIQDTSKRDQMVLLLKAALMSTKERPQSRPSMDDLLAMVKQIKEIRCPKASRVDWNVTVEEDPEISGASG